MGILWKILGIMLYVPYLDCSFFGNNTIVIVDIRFTEMFNEHSKIQDKYFMHDFTDLIMNVVWFIIGTKKQEMSRVPTKRVIFFVL